jgi:hypothetical protein
MSAGPFQTARYKADDGTTIAPVRVQPETLSLTVNGQVNASIPEAATTKYFVRTSGGCREIGLRCRRVNFKLDTAPAPYKQDAVLSLPWFDPDTFDAITADSAGTYIVAGTAEDITIVSTSDECGAGNV